MDVHNHSIVTGLGCSPTFEEEANLGDLEGPQATSTVEAKLTRHNVIHGYLSSFDEGAETAFEELEQSPENPPPCLIDGLQSRSVELHSSRERPPAEDFSSYGAITSSSLINVDALSGMSGSKFLIDHTELSQLPIEITQPSSDKFHKGYGVPSSMDHSDDEYDAETTTPQFTEQELENLETDQLDQEGSDLSQGENEESEAMGLGEQYLHPTSEIMRSGPLGSEDDYSQGFSHLSQFKNLNHTNEVSLRSEVKFDATQISARSTTFPEGLEHSKLFSTSCNSLGSLGEPAMEVPSEDIFATPCQEKELAMDWLQADQHDMASILAGESFHNFDMDFLEEEERENAKKNVFMQEESCTPAAGLEDTCFSGIHEIAEITVRPSWIHSPDRELVGPGNKMHIDDYLKMKSEALGSLGDCKDEERPHFGFGSVHSPPTNNAKLVPLVELSTLHNTEQSYLEPENNVGSSSTSSDSSSSFSSYHESSTMSLKSTSSSTSGNTNSGSSTFQRSPKDSSKGAVPKNKSREKLSLVSSQKDGMEYVIENPVAVTASVKRGDVESNVKENFMPISGKTSDHGKTQADSERLKSLLMADSLSGKSSYQSLVNKIIRDCKQESELHQTANMSELDASTEVLELRAQREALLAFKNKHAKLQESKEKENALVHTHAKPFKGSERPPLQPTVHSKGNKIDSPIHKQMERLKVVRTGSEPLSQSHTHNGSLEKYARLHTKGRQTGADLTEILMDESVRVIPYKSTILEDSQKSQLTSFRDSTNSSFDSSTPCAPRTRTKTNPSKGSHNNPPSLGVGHQAHGKDNQLASIPKVPPRPLPRMGLASSMGKKTVNRKLNSITSDIESAPEATRGMANLQSSRSETTLYPYSSSEGESRRSSSVPSGLQGLGVSGTQCHALPRNQVQFPRQTRLQESVLSDKPVLNPDGKVVVPQEVTFSSICLLGIASEEVMTFHNPKSRWVQLSLRLLQETVDAVPVGNSALCFKPSYFVEPKSSSEIRFSLCSQHTGSWVAVMEIKVSDLSKGSGRASPANVSVHTIILSAQIEEPKVHLSCEGIEDIDFGVLPESCILSREVTVINQSPHPIPTILTLRQVAATSPVFFWNDDCGGTSKVVSPSHLAIELPSADSETGPVPHTVKVFLRAPHLDKVKVDESGVFEITSVLQVELDTPDQSTLIISDMKMKAFIGVVRFQSLNTVEPLVMETKCDTSCTTSIPLRNASTFPLRLSVELKDHKELFNAYPNNLVIQPHASVSPSLIFNPNGHVGEFESVLYFCIEPEGKTYQMSVVGKSNAAPRQLIHAPTPLQRTLSAPVSKTQVNLSKALESSKGVVMFGTVAVGDQIWQKLVLRNSSCHTIPLNITVGGSKAFQVCNLGMDDAKASLNAVLEPKQELPLSIYFNPTTVEALSGNLICKPRGLSNPIKFQIPLQGYGGRSKLKLLDSPGGEPFVIRDISSQQSGVFHTALSNEGDREMFLKLQIFADEECSELVPTSDISVQPHSLMIKPKENCDVIISVNGTPSVISRTPGRLGFLQIVTGDEILRRRFKRNKNAKTKRVNDPGLLKIDWCSHFNGEKDVSPEDIGLPLQPEDARVFYNSCAKTRIQLNGERLVNEDASSTIFACLEAETTRQSISVADVPHLQEWMSEMITPQPQSSKERDIGMLEKNSNSPQKTPGWNIHPQMLTISASDASSHAFFIINFTSKCQMLEITSSLKWLSIEPQETMLPEKTLVRVSVRLVQSRIPKPFVSPVFDTLQVMGENESCSATITVTPATIQSSSVSTQSASSCPSVTVTPPSPREREVTDVPKLLSTEHHTERVEQSVGTKISNEGKVKEVRTTKDREAHRCSQTDPSNSAHLKDDSPVCDDVQKIEDEPLTRKRNVEVMSDRVVFPATPVGKDCFCKVKLRNFDSIVHPIKAKASHLPFLIRHHEFEMKPSHFIAIPIYFKPEKAGAFSGQLRFTLMNTMKVLTVHLSGEAI